MRSVPSSAPPEADPPLTTPASAEEAVMLTLVRLGRRMRQRLPGEDLDFAAIVLLKALLHGGPMRLSALATLLDLDASTVSRQVRHLEERGLIERATDPDDARASRVAVTQAGRDRLEAGVARRRAMVADLLDDWTAADREQLRTLLGRLLTDLDDQPENP